MTTIAIDHNTISADGRATDQNGYIARDNHNKLMKSGNVIYAYAGQVADAEMLVDIVIHDDSVSDISLSANLVTIDSEVILLHTLSKGVLRSESIEPPFCLGSGEHFALSAMDFGKTSKEAVKYAMTRDSSTGGKIKTMTWRK